MSSQIIIYTERLDLKLLLDLECKTLTGVPPVVKETVDDFNSILSLLSFIDILIVDEPSCPIKGKLVLDALLAKATDIGKVFFLGQNKIQLENAKSFSPSEIESLITHVKSSVGTDAVVALEYISVPSDSLIHFKMLPFDLYIKISSDKYVKRIPAYEDIDESTINTYKEKGIKELFFEKKFNRDFSMMLLNNMINKVETDYTTVDQKLKARDEVFVTTKELVQSFGLPPRVVQVCESVMESLSEDVSKSKDRFTNYLDQMKSQSNLSFQFRFVELTSYIATQLLDKTGNSAVEDVKKVIFAAFFCDVALSEASHLDYRTEESLKDLWPEDKDTIMNHAHKAAELVKKYKSTPPEADIIIMQHHGSLSGIGFKSASKEIHPLAKCLIASQELAFAILKRPDLSPVEVIKGVTDAHSNTPIHDYMVRFSELSK